MLPPLQLSPVDFLGFVCLFLAAQRAWVTTARAVAAAAPALPGGRRFCTAADGSTRGERGHKSPRARGDAPSVVYSAYCIPRRTQSLLGTRERASSLAGLAGSCVWVWLVSVRSSLKDGPLSAPRVASVPGG